MKGLSLLPDLPVAKAVYSVIVYHARGLHVGVHDGRADELEPPGFQILDDYLRLRCRRRDLRQGLETI